MNIQLLIDTSNKLLAVGLAINDNIVAKIQYDAWQKQSELTIKEINTMLNQYKIDPKSISKIVVSNGPGSYTGIRIGLTIAKIYATTLNIPLCLISSLNMLAGVNGEKIALIDARSKRAYVGVYKDGYNILNDTVLPLEQIDDLRKQYPTFTLVGDTNLFNIDKHDVDVINNLFELSKIKCSITNPHLAIPVYLKD